jgi:hypothetical protein
MTFKQKTNYKGMGRKGNMALERLLTLGKYEGNIENADGYEKFPNFCFCSLVFICDL